MRIFLANWVVVGMLLIGQSVSAAPPEPLSDADIEFLEFLGGWETIEGEAVDPMMFEALSVLDRPETDDPFGEGEGLEGDQSGRTVMDDFLGSERSEDYEDR